VRPHHPALCPTQAGYPTANSVPFWIAARAPGKACCAWAEVWGPNAGDASNAWNVNFNNGNLNNGNLNNNTKTKTNTNHVRLVRGG